MFQYILLYTQQVSESLLCSTFNYLNKRDERCYGRQYIYLAGRKWNGEKEDICLKITNSETCLPTILDE